MHVYTHIYFTYIVIHIHSSYGGIVHVLLGYSPLVLCLSELQQGDHFGYISATNDAKQIATANFRFTLHE